jgi:acetoin utilization deacetylase AcuC-like enzyme
MTNESSRVGLVTDARFERHDTGAGHPEKPERLERCREALTAAGIPDRCRIVDCVRADDAMLRRVHDADHIAHVAEFCASGQRLIDGADTAVSIESDEIARLAAGSVTALADAVARGELDRGFAAVRPPGHHAERDRAMGFCLYNNVAVAAEHVRQSDAVTRVLVVDWDVHHGNGTQHIFEENGEVFYFSLHQWPLYPGTGAREETGRGAGAGATLNCPLPPGAGDDAFLAALRDELVPAADRFRPDFVFISAGFDAHRDDPLAALEVTEGAFAEATRILIDLAERHADGRLVSVLEGGYDLDALSASMLAHLDVLLPGPGLVQR